MILNVHVLQNASTWNVKPSIDVHTSSPFKINNTLGLQQTTLEICLQVLFLYVLMGGNFW